jgi:hypothetical protein
MGNKKRGRPRKYMKDNLISSSNLPDSKQLQSEFLGENINKQPVIEDWSLEINDEQILPNSESPKSNGKGECSDLLSNMETDSNTNSEVSDNISTHINSHLQHELDNNSNQLNSHTKLDTTIHIIDGEKGGAGKSFVSKTLIEYCASINHEVLIVDADISNQDIAKIYPNVKPAFFSDDEKLAKKADEIFDLAFDKSVIVNLPAQVYSNVTNWIKNNDLAEVGKENSITFVKWFVCTGAIDSVNFFIQSLDDLGDKITHVFVRNQGLCDDWEYIKNMTEFQEAAKKYNFIVMDFPKFPFWERNAIDRLEIKFTDAISHPELKVVSKQRVKNFLKVAYTSFAETGLIR